MLLYFVREYKVDTVIAANSAEHRKELCVVSSPTSSSPWRYPCCVSRWRSPTACRDDTAACSFHVMLSDNMTVLFCSVRQQQLLLLSL